MLRNPCSHRKSRKYCPIPAEQIRSREGLTATDAKVLHFNQPVKPWMADAMLAWGLDPIPVAAFKLWYDAWMNCLAARRLRLLAQSGAIFPVTPPDSRRLHPR